MRIAAGSMRFTLAVFMSVAIATGAPGSAFAQSQESKPSAAATPAATAESPQQTPTTGVFGNRWLGPLWGVEVAWDADAWTVENELIEGAYEGLQIGTSNSTAFIEAYEGFKGNGDDCLAAAERELGERSNVSEVVRLSGRPLPDTGLDRGSALLFGVVATLPDGAIYRGVEYIECRTLTPGIAVLELTWQTAARNFNAELPVVSDLFRSVIAPVDERAESAEPTSTPRATPVAASS